MKKVSLLFACALHCGCSVDTAQLAGRWQAVAFYENGASVQTPLQEVNLTFSPDGGYIFNSIGYYREAGHFRSSMKYLYLSDTTVRPSKDRMLKVTYLSADTLKLEMKKEDRLQALFMTKQR